MQPVEPSCLTSAHRCGSCPRSAHRFLLLGKFRLRSASPALDWLPHPPGDVRQRIAAIARDTDGEAAWRNAVAIARTRLNFSTTNALAAATSSREPDVKLAVLGSSTMHHLAGALRVGAMRRGLAATLYEPDYGQFRQDLADPSSGLHAFAPTNVLFAFDAETVGAHARHASDPAEAAALAERLLEDWRALWTAARRAGSAIMQQAVLPRIPAFGGSNDHRLPHSAAAFIARVNAGLRAYADQEGVDVVAVDARVAVDGLDAWFSASSWLSAKQEVALPAAPLYGDLVARIVAARRGLGAKCCVFDLDNTLWGGVIGDDGVDGIVLGQGSAAGEAFLELHHLALALKRRGILLAVCSKNDEAVARAAFDHHADMVLKRSDFACFVANWQDKASNLRAIAAALNIGTDALVFVDDNPFEREQVRAALPEVLVPELPEDPALVPRCLAECGCFELVTLTSEDAARADLYAADSERTAAREQSGDLGAYLASLDMVLEHAPVGEGDVARATQLLNKTNQFNLATRRLSEDEFRHIAADETALALRFRLKDRFGDTGVIAVVTGRFVEAQKFTIDDWLMSCRVIGRDVEYATLCALIERLRARSVRQARGALQTKRAQRHGGGPSSKTWFRDDDGGGWRQHGPAGHRRLRATRLTRHPRGDHDMIDAAVVQAGLADIFSEVFMRDDIAIDPALTAKDVPGWDSFKQVEIIMAAEERFRMRFTSSEVDRFQCLGDLMDAVAKRGSS